MRLLFGVRATSLDEACALVERVLGVNFEPRESMHYGGDYCWFRGPGVMQLVLQHNFDALEDDFDEPEFSDERFLLKASGMPADSPVLVTLRDFAQSHPRSLVVLRTEGE